MEEISREATNAAQSAFKNGDYGNCSRALENMKSAKNANRFTLHTNAALIDFAQSGWTATEKYKEAIGKLKELAKTEGQSDAILRYNEAVLAFHARRWSDAVQILQKMQSAKTPASIRIEAALLLAETFLKLCDPEHAVAVLSKIETVVAADSKENVTESQKHRHFVAKVRSCLMMRNVRRCKKEIKSMPSDISPHPWTLAMFKAHQEYLRENYRKSLRLIVVATESASSEQQKATVGDDCMLAIVNNAFGCNYAKMNKFHLAISYFEKAINEYQNTRAEWSGIARGKGFQSLPVYASHLTGYWATMHNYALALLQAGFTERAFDCFVQIVKVYPRNARLWLRLAECCIIARQKNNEAEFNLEQRRHECVQDVVGVGPHRKIVLNSNLTNKKRGPSEEAAVPALTYEFAYLCLKNAFLMLPTLTQDQLRTITESPTNSSSSSEREIVLLWPSAPQNPLGVKELYRLKCSVLCAKSYVALSISEYGTSLESAKALLAMEYVSPIHKLLANFYAAESLICMNRLHEASAHLPLDPLNDMVVTEFASSTSHGLPADWHPKNVKTATLALLYNVGVVCHLMGESAKANEITKLVRAAITSGGECPVLAIVQTLHQLLQKERLADAKTFLCTFFPYLQIGELQSIT